MVILEPLHLFENIQDEDNRRPDILISNPYGGGPQIILDVAVTGVNGQSRRSDTETDQPLEFRCDQNETNSQPARFVNRGINHTFIYIYLPGFKSYIFGKKSERQKRVNIIWRGASQLLWYGSRLTDHWACYREIMYIHLMCEGSSLLSNIICSVLDVKSFYLSHQQHLNQLDTAVR